MQQLKPDTGSENPGKPGLDAPTRPLGGGGDAKADAAAKAPPRGIAFDIPIVQKTKPGLKGTLRIEARPWELSLWAVVAASARCQGKSLLTLIGRCQRGQTPYMSRKKAR